MSKNFEYTDDLGRVREIEAFIVTDFSDVKKANAPLRLGPDGYLSPSVINPVQDYGIKAKTESFTLTSGDVSSKKIVLSNIPVSTPTFTPDGALSQRYGIDFVYQESDNSLTWATLGLEGFLEVGETIEVSYFYK